MIKVPQSSCRDRHGHSQLPRASELQVVLFFASDFMGMLRLSETDDPTRTALENQKTFLTDKLQNIKGKKKT